MWAKLEQYGKLTQGQMEAAMTALDRMQARAAAKAASRFVGEVGERIDLTVTVEKRIRIEFQDGFGGHNRYGTSYTNLYLCRDEHGNRIVYKGTGDFPGEGQTARVKATISEHSEYNSEAQTKVSRPKVVEKRTDAA